MEEKIKEFQDKILEITKDFTPEQYQDISFGLVRIGEFLAEKNFPHPVARVINSLELANVISEQVGIPKTVMTLNDYEYNILGIEDVKRILLKRGIWYNTNREDNPWVLDTHDCDNHAYKCASDVGYIFDINSVNVDSGAMVWKDKEGVEHRDSHKFNVVVAVDTDGTLGCWLYEAQENYITKFVNKKAWRGNCDYQVYWIEAF